MRKIASIVNTSVFQAQILTEIVTQLLNKWESLLKVVIAGAEEDNSATGYFKWIVRSDHLAHNVLYDIKLGENTSKALGLDDNIGDSKTLGNMYKWIKHFVNFEILSEDYIKTLIIRYNANDNEENQNKLETMWFKLHHQVFLHIMDILRLIEYLNFKTPTLSLIHHFLNDKAVLAKLKDVYSAICDVLGNKENLEFYTKVLTEIETRVKGKKDDESWGDWVTSVFNNDDKGKHIIVKEEDDDDNLIEDDQFEDEKLHDEEEMHIVLHNIQNYIMRLFETWEKLFILNGKNEQIKDWFANLMHHRLAISTKQNMFKNQVEEGELVVKTKPKESGDVFQLLTVSSILPFLEISLPDENSNLGVTVTDKKHEHDYLYSIQEFEKVNDLMKDRLDLIWNNFLDVADDEDEIKPLFNWISIVYTSWYKTYKDFTEKTFEVDGTTKEAFK